MATPPSPIGRLAPSPTGRLHVGHARSFLSAWWSVRSRGGKLLLRIDDLDHTRLRPGMLEACLQDLEWLGLDWDGEPILQSERSAAYDAALERLQQQGLVYPCVCTRREIESSLSAPHAGEDEVRYPGTCRDRYASIEAAEEESGRKAGLRFRVPEGEVAWEDQLLGERSSPVADQVGDFLVARRDQVYAYQLACAVDDGELGITEVLRGADLTESTPRQELIQRALGLSSPSWTHVSLVTNAKGRRLAKRDGSISLASLRESGVDPRALIAWAAKSCGMAPKARLTASEALASFDASKLSNASVAFELAYLDRY